MLKKTAIARALVHSTRGYTMYLSPDDDGGGGGGAATITAEVQALIDAKVGEVTTGLKAKNGELLGKLKESNDNLKRFDGIDPDAVRTILSKFASDEEAGLLKAGKIDEVLSKRTERMQADHEKVIKAEQERATRAEAKASKLAARTLAGAVRDAALKSGALLEAMDDIVLRSNGLWRLNDDGEPVAMNGDEVIFGKDGKTPLSTVEWAESLRETAPHLWPKAQGSGAQGSGKGGGNGGKKTLSRAEFDGLNATDRSAKMRAGFTITD